MTKRRWQAERFVPPCRTQSESSEAAGQRAFWVCESQDYVLRFFIAFWSIFNFGFFLHFGLFLIKLFEKRRTNILGKICVSERIGAKRRYARPFLKKIEAVVIQDLLVVFL